MYSTYFLGAPSGIYDLSHFRQVVEGSFLIRAISSSFPAGDRECLPPELTGQEHRDLLTIIKALVFPLFFHLSLSLLHLRSVTHPNYLSTLPSILYPLSTFGIVTPSSKCISLPTFLL